MTALRLVSRCFPLLLALCLVGCGGPDPTPLVGKWRLDGADELAELMTGVKKPKGALGLIVDSALDAMQDQLQAELEVEFAAGGRLITRSQFGDSRQEKTGTWELRRTDGTTFVVITKIDGEESNEITIRKSDGDTIKMVPPNIAVLDRSFTFRRVEP